MPKTMWRFEQFFLRSWKIPFYKNKTIPIHLQAFYYTYEFKKLIISSSYWWIWNPTSHQNLKMTSNSSPNDIPSKFLKIASCIVSEWLSKFFIKCMTNGEHLDSWKIAHITPIPKVHSPNSSSHLKIHYHSTRLATSKNLFLPRVNSSSGKCSLKFIGPKVWSSIPNEIKFSTTFTSKWKLKKHLLHEKKSQLWTLATFSLSRTKYCVF